jgi:serralysin
MMKATRLTRLLRTWIVCSLGAVAVAAGITAPKVTDGAEPGSSLAQQRQGPANRLVAADTCMVLPGGGRLGKPDQTRGYGVIQWTSKNQLNVIFKDGDDDWNRKVQAKLKDIVKEWEDYAKISFTFDPNGSRDITIQFEPDATYPDYGVYQSLLGPNSHGENPSMWLLFQPQTTDDELKRVILHEFGHALGLIHEQTRPDVKIGWKPDAVYKYYSFTGWSKDQIDEQVMKPSPFKALRKSPFDLISIMIYPIPKGLAAIEAGGTKDLSPMDKVFIASFYPFKPAEPSPPEKELELSDEWTNGEITAKGQVVRFRFDAPKGNYAIETKGETPLLIGLIGPANVASMQGNAAAEGTAPKIEGMLDPANFPSTDPTVTYRVEVRHQHPKVGRGAFAVRVRGK